MNEEELISKLRQIEEQARLTLEEFPKNLTRERQRMIIALAKYIRADIEDRTPASAEALARLDAGDAAASKEKQA
ncbi:MAG: hypothetical protein ACT4P3_13120 [Betaproteobacteria bacterium]